MTINHNEKTAIARLAAVATVTDLRGQGAPTIHSVSISQHTQAFGYVQYGRIARCELLKTTSELEQDLLMSVAGHVAEMYGTAGSGSTSAVRDLEKARRIAEDLADRQNIDWRASDADLPQRLVASAMQRAEDIITQNADIIEAMIGELMTFGSVEMPRLREIAA